MRFIEGSKTLMIGGLLMVVAGVIAKITAPEAPYLPFTLIVMGAAILVFDALIMRITRS